MGEFVFMYLWEKRTVAGQPRGVSGDGVDRWRPRLCAVCIAYALPILLRVSLAHGLFVPGPFSLRRRGVLVAWIAVLWVAAITVLFSLPVSYPVTKGHTPRSPSAGSSPSCCRRGSSVHDAGSRARHKFGWSVVISSL
ncbi:hypothetical protein E2562_019760 [Oryza meyeriana var. granulata]|uniref:Uncharacterized protein n=1 Tax=Oryza meyeriana var. granulata TaxID=110450 RepID=A0A6G1DJZ3_9ORYZ|nr:hypothetical protein E2562_019760 [Oryza meyeriana var. granulata]